MSKTLEQKAFWKNFSLNNIENEEWKDIENFEGIFQVSNYGRIKSLSRKIICGKGERQVSEKILRQAKYYKGKTGRTSGGFNALVASLYLDGKIYRKTTSVIVAESFLKEKIDQNKTYYIFHKNGDKFDNRVENLHIGYGDDISNAISDSKKQNRKSKYKGVIAYHSYGKDRWTARIYFDGNTISKECSSEVEAAKQYDLFVEQFKLKRKKNYNN